MKIKIPWKREKPTYDCEKGKHKWTKWELLQNIKVFEKEGDKLPTYVLRVQERKCDLCGLSELKKDKM